MTYYFELFKYNDTIEKILINKKTIKIKRSCRFIAKEYLTKKYIDSKKYDFIELK